MIVFWLGTIMGGNKGWVWTPASFLFCTGSYHHRHGLDNVVWSVIWRCIGLYVLIFNGMRAQGRNIKRDGRSATGDRGGPGFFGSNNGYHCSDQGRDRHRRRNVRGCGRFGLTRVVFRGLFNRCVTSDCGGQCTCKGDGYFTNGSMAFVGHRIGASIAWGR